MARPADLTTRNRLTDWVEARHKRLILPSWLMSAMIHGAMLGGLLWISQDRRFGPDYAGDNGDGFREVGVYLTTDSGESDPSEIDAEIPDSQPVASVPDGIEAPLLDGPPIKIEPPGDLAAGVLGLGGPPSLPSGKSAASSLATTGIPGPPTTARGVLGKSTSLFGIQDAGRRFVYVLDRSGSMSDYGAMRSAKAELKASLENLDATQEFQVIFYNTEPVMLAPTNARFQLFRGIDPHRSDVDRQLGAFQPEGGTSHLAALQAALKLNADVIFFLTDAADPGLTADDLETIQRKNNGARIHCIEFGEGPSLQQRGGPRNFLQKLAEQNGGRYQYRDVKRLHP